MILLYLLVPAAYLAAALLEWRRLAGTCRAAAAGVRRTVAVDARHCVRGHAALLTGTVFTREGLDLSLVNAMSAVAGLTALVAGVGLGGALPGVSAVTFRSPQLRRRCRRSSRTRIRSRSSTSHWPRCTSRSR